MAERTREQQRQDLRDHAVVRANRLGRSIVCGEYGRHDRCKGGAKLCLCECHDPAPVLSGQPEADQ